MVTSSLGSLYICLGAESGMYRFAGEKSVGRCNIAFRRRSRAALRNSKWSITAKKGGKYNSKIKNKGYFLTCQSTRKSLCSTRRSWQGSLVTMVFSRGESSKIDSPKKEPIPRLLETALMSWKGTNAQKREQSLEELSSVKNKLIL
jgi:hypothetical protein